MSCGDEEKLTSVGSDLSKGSFRSNFIWYQLEFALLSVLTNLRKPKNLGSKNNETINHIPS